MTKTQSESLIALAEVVQAWDNKVSNPSYRQLAQLAMTFACAARTVLSAFEKELDINSPETSARAYHTHEWIDVTPANSPERVEVCRDPNCDGERRSMIPGITLISWEKKPRWC